MERFILKKMLDWKNSPYRKPLILKGVRQVGKTWVLKEFGKRYYENTAAIHAYEVYSSILPSASLIEEFMSFTYSS